MHCHNTHVQTRGHASLSDAMGFLASVRMRVLVSVVDGRDGVVLWDQKRNVFEDGANDSEVAAHSGPALGTAAHDRAAEVGEAADNEVGTE
jgi:hypothetical protein